MSEIEALAAPDPATNPWVPIWNLAPTVALDYVGAWAAGTYVDGQVVIDNGVAYMCVRQTTKRPTPWAPISLGYPGAELGYTAGIASVNVTATLEASATTVITAPAITFDGVTAVLIEFYSPYIRIPASGGVFIDLWLFDGGSSIGRLAHYEATSGNYVPMFAARKITPSGGSHTYSVRAHVNTGTGVVAGGPGAAPGQEQPMFIRVTRVVA